MTSGNGQGVFLQCTALADTVQPHGAYKQRSIPVFCHSATQQHLMPSVCVCVCGIIRYGLAVGGGAYPTYS